MAIYANSVILSIAVTQLSPIFDDKTTVWHRVGVIWVNVYPLEGFRMISSNRKCHQHQHHHQLKRMMNFDKKNSTTHCLNYLALVTLFPNVNLC